MRLYSKFQIPDSKQTGFTLIEAVVATSVFAFVVSSIIGVYLSTIQLDQKTRSQRAVTQNARFIMEYLAKEIRNGAINYASYSGGVVSGTSDLYIENEANVIEHFYLSGTNLVLAKGAATTNLNSGGAKVTDLKFYIVPTGNPYTPAKTYNTQPYVTVVLELTSNYGTNTADIAELNLQSTFTTRIYPSRQ